MAQARGRTRPVSELWGVLLPAKDREAEVEEEQDDPHPDPDSLFVDASELCSSGRVLRASLPARRKVIIQDERSQKTYEVVGYFPLVGPWWKVNVKVKLVDSKYFVQGYPSYFLRTDIRENQNAVFSLFFKECCVPDNFREEFFKCFPEISDLNFRNLEEKLNQFQESKLNLQQGNTSIETKNFDIFYYIMQSFTGKTVLVALSFPVIMEFLPRLLPRHFCNIIEAVSWHKVTKQNSKSDEKVSPEDEILPKLDEMLKKEPWKLGFSRITYKELNLSTCEATWAAFCQCEHLLWKIPELQKNALIIYDKLKQRCREMGHTYEEQDILTSLVSNDMPIEHAWQSLKFMKDEKIMIGEKKLVFLSHLYKSEKDIALSVNHLMKNDPWQLPVDVRKVLNVRDTTKSKANGDIKINHNQPPETEQVEGSNAPDIQNNSDSDFLYNEQVPDIETTSEAEADPDQMKAVKMICSNPVTIISGKGGCGKTTVVSCLFQYLKQVEKEVASACNDFEKDLDASAEWNTFNHFCQENICTKNLLNVLLTAPTGRAASLLNEKTELPAYTLHQVIYSFYSWRLRDGRMPWKFSTVTVLVVDEGSLVPVQMLSSVLKLLCDHAQLAKLIILGDIRQLPSIDPGNMLADIFEGLKSRGWSVELRTNHRAESQLIVDNATRISQRKFPEFDSVLKVSDWSEKLTMPTPEKKFIYVVLPSGHGAHYLQTAIQTLLEKGPGLQDAKQSQFIAFRRQDCDLINELCCQHYSKHLTRNHKNRLVFQCDDKICSTRNAYLKDLLPKNNTACTRESDSQNPNQCECRGCCRRKAFLSGQNLPGDLGGSAEDDRRLCNGEIFFITDDVEVDKCRLLTISSTYGSKFTVVYEALKRECQIKHAWARTIHTFQGSEERTIVYVVGNAGPQHWQHVYTAVTRGCCRVYIVAEESQLRKAVTTKSFPRKTRLQQRLRETFAEMSDSPEQMSSHLKGCWQSQGHDTQPGPISVTEDIPLSSVPVEDDFIKAEEPAVLNDIQTNNGQWSTAELASAGSETPVKSNGCKRPGSFTDSFESPSKVTMVNNEGSPLASTRLQNLTLRSPTPKQLFGP
ncbi:DNA helicase B [Trachemys scripta elegans]|uniref:DNA helicase B n=1 Tax=Trachemys scripta elegans TaxID=31138 RepID=UPI001556D07B|nr:DNA helicase B [Trachemys scripta elegans]